MNIVRLLKGSKEIQNAGWIIGGRIAQMILSLVVSVLTARYLGPSNYGLINYGATYVAFFTSLCLLGLNSILLKDIIENPDEQGVALGTSIVLRLIASIASVVLVFIIVFFIDYDSKTTIIVVTLCSLSLLFQSFDVFNYWFQSRYESKISSIATLIAYVITAVYRLIMLYQGMSVEWFAVATVVDHFCIAIIMYYCYKKRKGPHLTFSLEKAKALLSNSYHYILSSMMVAIYSQTDKMMLKHIMNEENVGFYSLATSLNSMWVFILVAIIDSMFPTIMKLYNTDKEGYLKKNRQLYCIVIYASFSVAVFFVIFGQKIIQIMYGNEYLPATAPLNVVAWYTAFAYLGSARNAWMVCEKKQKYLKYLYSSAAIMNVLLNLLLIPQYGATGAAVASLFTQISTNLVFPCFICELRPNVRLMIDAFCLKGVR